MYKYNIYVYIYISCLARQKPIRWDLSKYSKTVQVLLKQLLTWHTIVSFHEICSTKIVLGNVIAFFFIFLLSMAPRQGVKWQLFRTLIKYMIIFTTVIEDIITGYNIICIQWTPLAYYLTNIRFSRYYNFLDPKSTGTVRTRI